MLSLNRSHKILELKDSDVTIDVRVEWSVVIRLENVVASPNIFSSPLPE